MGKRNPEKMKNFLFILIIILAFSLRIFHLGINPPSLYWDEASLGYNAYTIATSLKDEHGEFLPLARFIAFGDYKPPGYIYAAVPSILIFGLNEFSVRFPSMLAGLLMVFMTYYLTVELFRNLKIAMLASFLLAISPWAVHFSRAAFEANLAAFFNLSGIYFFLLCKRKKPAILVSVIIFILSFYIFNANRIIAPLMLLGLSVLNLRILLSNKKWVLVAFIISLMLLIPSISFLRSSESKLRFQEVSIFNNPAPVIQANAMISQDGNSWWANIMHNRRILYAGDFLKHYFDNFSGRFLFTQGDVNPRLAVQSMGELFVWDLPFLLLGIYWLVKKKEKNLLVIFLWMAVSVIPAATARETPHALRILSILPTYQFIVAFGLYQVVTIIKSRLSLKPFFLLSVVCFLLSANIYYYLHDYYIHFPRDWSGEWQYGYKEMVNFVLANGKNYDKVFVTNALGRPYIYFAFYKPYSLPEFIGSADANRDGFGFWDVKTLGKIRFNLDALPVSIGRSLIVTTPNNIPGAFHELKRIKNLAGDDVFIIGEKT